MNAPVPPSPLARALARHADAVVIGEGDEPGLDGIVALPVSDRASVAVAVGMALGGARPVVLLSSPGRLTAVLEPLRTAAAWSADGTACPVVVAVPWGHEAGDRLDGAALGVLAGLEGVVVRMASDPATLQAVLDQALSAYQPTVVLVPRALSRADHGAGQAAERTLRDGHHVTLAAWGPGVATAMEAAEALSHEGVSAAVVELVSLAPLDAETLAASVRRTGRCVVAAHPHDHAMASVVHQAVLREAFLYLESPLGVGPDDDPAGLAKAALAAVHY